MSFSPLRFASLTVIKNMQRPAGLLLIRIISKWNAVSVYVNRLFQSRTRDSNCKVHTVATVNRAQFATPPFVDRGGRSVVIENGKKRLEKEGETFEQKKERGRWRKETWRIKRVDEKCKYPLGEYHTRAAKKLIRKNSFSVSKCRDEEDAMPEVRAKWKMKIDEERREEETDWVLLPPLRSPLEISRYRSYIALEFISLNLHFKKK